MLGKWQAVAAIFAAVSTCALAQGREPIETRLEARKVVREADGRDAFAPADAARPGETLEYVATYRNVSDEAVRDLVATLPIPANTEWIPGSARPANVQASTDGRTFAPLPLKRRVTREGRSIEEEVPAREYRYLRWAASELASKQSLVFMARVKVAQAPPPSAGTR